MPDTKSASEAVTPAGEAEMKPTGSSYPDVNGIKLYQEIYGQEEPLMLIHGGLTTIGEMQGWVQLLAKTVWLIIPRYFGSHDGRAIVEFSNHTRVSARGFDCFAECGKQQIAAFFEPRNTVLDNS